MRPLHTWGGAAAGALLLATQLAGPATTAKASADAPPPAWAPASGSTIHPGSRLQTAATICTGNFVFFDGAGNVYVGQAARCAASEPEKDADKTGCQARSLPLGTAVTFTASRVTGKLAYSSWLAMQAAGERDSATCRGNDFALVKVPDYAEGQVNPSVPLFGGPVGLNTAGTDPGELVLGYGNSDIRGDLNDLKPKQAVSVGDGLANWLHLVYSVSPSIDGDTGGPYMDGGGNALGSYQATVIGPPPGADAVTDIAKALGYAQQHSGIKGLKLALGTAAFEGPYVISPLLNQIAPPGR